MKPAATLMFTLPVTATVDVPATTEPPTVSPPWAVSAKLLALVLSVPLTVSKPVTVSAAPNVLVPAPWVMLLKLCPAASVIVPVAPKMTVDVPLFSVAFVAVEVQLPLSVPGADETARRAACRFLAGPFGRRPNRPVHGRGHVSGG